jgi:hypothetical protein
LAATAEGCYAAAMLTKVIVWGMILIGILPVLSFAVPYFRILPPIRKQVIEMKDQQVGEVAAFVGGTSVGVFGAPTTPVYFRGWTIVIGLIGAACLIVFAVFTLHIPSQPTVVWSDSPK